MFMSLKLIAIGLGHKLGHSERLEHVIYKAEYINWTVYRSIQTETWDIFL